MKTATIHHDRDCESPRECSNIGIMALFHRRMNVPNESGMDAPDVQAHVGEGFSGVVLPVYMYEHGGVSLSTRPFSCPWDSGQLGVIYVSWETLREEFGEDEDEDVLRDRAEVWLQSEVEGFGQWLNGECYGYVIKGEDGSDSDSCWGFLGYDTVVEAAKEAGAEKIVGEVQD